MGDMRFLFRRREGDGGVRRVPWLLWALPVCCAEPLQAPFVVAVRAGRDGFASFRPNMGDVRYLFARQ